MYKDLEIRVKNFNLFFYLNKLIMGKYYENQIKSNMYIVIIK